jgi:hypothetical protein
MLLRVFRASEVRRQVDLCDTPRRDRSGGRGGRMGVWLCKVDLRQRREA